jgi:hypothetical protein
MTPRASPFGEDRHIPVHGLGSPRRATGFGDPEHIPGRHGEVPVEDAFCSVESHVGRTAGWIIRWSNFLVRFVHSHDVMTRPPPDPGRRRRRIQHLRCQHTRVRWIAASNFQSARDQFPRQSETEPMPPIIYHDCKAGHQSRKGPHPLQAGIPASR